MREIVEQKQRKLKKVHFENQQFDECEVTRGRSQEVQSSNSEHYTTLCPACNDNSGKMKMNRTYFSFSKEWFFPIPSRSGCHRLKRLKNNKH